MNPYLTFLTLMQMFGVTLCLFRTEQMGNAAFSYISKCSADYKIAGLVRLHTSDKESLATETCRAGRVTRTGLYEALAIIYAVKQINRDASLLPGLTLGTEIFDICSLQFAMQSYLGLDFVNDQYGISKTNYQFHDSKPGPTFAVIGTGPTKIANSLSTLSNVFDVPIISFSATSPLLSNEHRFRTFFRTVPNDELSTSMILELLEKFRWSLVSVIYSDTEYGETAFHTFQKRLKEKLSKRGHHFKICLGFVKQFKEEDKDDDLFGKDSEFSKSKVVIVFAHSRDAKIILQRALRTNITDKIWLLSACTITSKQLCSDEGEAFSGKIITANFKHENNEEFTKFIVENVIERTNRDISVILPEIEQVRVWVRNKANGRLKMAMPPSVSYVVDAVKAAAHALHIALNCSRGRCQKVDSFRQKNVLQSMFKVNFTSQLGHNMSFNKNGDTKGIYVLNSIKIAKNECSYSEVGEWRSFGTPSGFIYLDQSIAKTHKSSCGKCPPGWGRLIKKAGDCCRPCEKCTGNEYKSNRSKQCEKCPNDSVPDDRHTGCIKLIKRYLTLTNNKFGIACLCTTTTGLGLVIGISVIFYKYRDTHLVRASNKELTLVLLVAIVLGYATPLVTLMTQSKWLCTLYVYMKGLSFSLMIGALFTKVNRIYRIFRKQGMRTANLKFMSVKWQMFFISIFVILEMLAITLTINQKQDSITVIPIRTRQYIDMFCCIDIENLVLLWSINATFIILCAYQAFLSRRVPTEYNESQSIFLVMIFLVLQNIFYGMSFFRSGGIVHPLLINVPLYLSATTVTAVFFGYKVYVILFKPDQNQVQMPHGSLGIFLSTRRKRKRTMMADADEADHAVRKQSNTRGMDNAAFSGDNT